jgi:hypothetical protein
LEDERPCDLLEAVDVLVGQEHALEVVDVISRLNCVAPHRKSTGYVLASRIPFDVSNVAVLCGIYESPVGAEFFVLVPRSGSPRIHFKTLAGHDCRDEDEAAFGDQ